MTDQTQNPAAGNVLEREAHFWPFILLGATVLLIAIGFLMHYNETAKAQWVPMLGVLMTLGVFSVLYKENPVFRFLEHILVGLATGFGVLFIWFNFLLPNWYQPMMPNAAAKAGELHGQWWLIFALLLALMFYSVYFSKLAWMNRFLIGVVMGWSAGYAFQGFVSVVAPQLRTSFKPPVTTYDPLAGQEANHILQQMNNIHIGNIWFHPFAVVFIIVLLCAMTYFFFSVEHRTKWIRKPANAGRYFIMIALGAIFGTTVMGRITLLIGRMDFVKNTLADWWHLLVK
jgi:hypothetical protein